MRKEKAIEALMAYLTSGDERGAMRFYVENRVSRATYNEAKTRAARWLKHFEDKERGR